MSEEFERMRENLLAIIDEGRNLTSGYVEVKTGIKIKAGREREFQRLCDNYYEIRFNQIIENNTDTITPVYEDLTKIIETEKEDFYVSKAADYVLEVKNEVERFKNLQKSFRTTDNAYKLTIRNLNDLYLKRESTTEWQQKVDELNTEIRRLAENSTILTEQLKAARKNINDTLIRYAEEQMQILRNDFLKANRGIDKAPTMDHNFVIASDQLEYDSLYRLSLILKYANEIDDLDKLVIVDDAMIVTEEQKDILTKTTLPNIRLYGYIKPVEKKDPKKEKNQEFIDKVLKMMDSVKEHGKGGLTPTKNGLLLLPAAAKEYDKLLEVLSFVNKANSMNLELVPVWDQVYVLGQDKNQLINLLKSINSFKGYDPDREKENANEKLINDLLNYLDRLASKVTEYKGVTNLPIKSTNTLGDKAWVVTEKDWKEANRVIEIIKLLQEQQKLGSNLNSIWNIAYVSFNDIPKFKKLARGTVFFNKIVPDIPENKVEMEKVMEQLKSLIEKAKKQENPKMASNGLVLEEDEELYNLLNEKYNYLFSAKTSDNLVPVDNILVDGDHVIKYREINEKINSLLGLDNKINFDANDKEIENLKNRLAELSAKTSHNETERKEFDLLTELIDILERAKNSSSVIDKNGFKFASEEDADKYLQLKTNLDELQAAVLPNSSVNDEEIKKVKAEMRKIEEKAKKSKNGEMASNGKVLQKDLSKYEALENQLQYLEEAKNSSDLVDVDGVQIDRAHVEDYKKASKVSNKGLRKKIIRIRNHMANRIDALGNIVANNNMGKFIIKHKTLIKVVLGVGLGVTAVTFAFPQLIPSIVYSMSCNMASVPILNGFSTLFSSIAAPGVGAMNIGVNANVVAISLVNSLAKAGIVGVGTVYGLNRFNDYLNKDLSGLEKKTLCQRITESWNNIFSMNKVQTEEVIPINDETPKPEVVPIPEIPINQVLIPEPEIAQTSETASSPVVDSESTPKKEMTDEERRILGEKILQASRKNREDAQLAQAEKLAKEESISVDEALERIQKRSEELLRSSGSTSTTDEKTDGTSKEIKTGYEPKDDKSVISPDYYSETRSDASLEEARKLQAAEMEAEKQETKTVPPVPPVVTVPSNEEIMSQLNLSQEEIQKKSNGSPVEQKEESSGKPWTQEEIEAMLHDLDFFDMDKKSTIEIDKQIELAKEYLFKATSESDIEYYKKAIKKLKDLKVKILLASRTAISDDTLTGSKTAEVTVKVAQEGETQSTSTPLQEGLNEAEKRELATLKEEVERIQFTIDKTVDPMGVITKAYKERLEIINIRIAELEEKERGRGR